MGETLFTGVKPVDDNNEIVEIQSVEEPIYMQELAEEITVEKDKEDVIVDVKPVEDTFIQNNKHYILPLNPEECFWQTGEIDKLYNKFAVQCLRFGVSV